MLAAAAALAGACASDTGLMAVPTTADAPPSADVELSLRVAGVESVGLPAPPFPDDVKAAVGATLDRYLQDAVLGPLRSGGPAADLGPLFTGPARARLDGPDRAALVDEGLPAAASVRTEAATAKLSALVGPAGAVAVVTAALDLRLEAGDVDPVSVARTGHLVLVPAGDGWKIDGYDVRTVRKGGDGATTTTANG